jgi:hypothetical protein
LLERELSHLAAEEITIEAFFRPDEIRNDGWPRSTAQLPHPFPGQRVTSLSG